ncbi:MAG: PAS domain S-box protein [Myxococcales bacterium]|nr:PAS domain S-box protein [Myxococcales bacterium]
MSTPFQEALRREARFAEALSEATRGIVVVMDDQGRITHANEFLAELAGVASPDALLGRDWFQTFIPPRDHERIRSVFQQALAGEPVYRNRNPVIDAAGREHDIEWSARRLFDGDGQVLGLLSVGIDVSETRSVERQLERQQARLASVIEGTMDAFIFIDRRAHIVAFNPAAERIFGYAAAEVLGQKVNMLMPDPYRREHDGYIERYERTSRPRAIGRIRVVQGQRRSGEVFPIELSITKVGVDDEARYAAFLRDISEKVKLRERVLEHERLVAIGTTSAKFAHEVGNPLNGMLMNLQLIRRRIAKQVPVEQLQPLVERVEGEVRRLAGLLDEFRGMSRRQSFVFVAAQLRELVEQFIEGHREHFRAHGVRLEASWDDELPDVHVDREKITQVLLNLVKNAAEAMGEGGGVVSLRVRAQELGVILDVTDTGGGVPDGVDVFEPFVTTKALGTGLGLPVVRQIVAGHGGELTYDSRPGVGTTFHVWLPIDPPSASSINLRLLPF